MVIESVNAAASAYQGSAPGTADRQTAEPKKEVISPETVQEQTIQNSDSAASNQPSASALNGEQEAAKQNEQIKRAVENINRTNQQTEAVFGIHEGTNRVTIKIVDRESKKVIKEYPPEKTLDMIEKVWEMAGLMVDEKR